MKKLNCLLIQEKEITRLIYREKTILSFARYHNRVQNRLPVLKLVLLLTMGAGQAQGGLQATGLMPAALGQWGLQAPIHHKCHQAKPHANLSELFDRMNGHLR
jgi:hypothetical protein